MTQDGDIKLIGDISKYMYYLQNDENSKILLKDKWMFSLVRK